MFINSLIDGLVDIEWPRHGWYRFRKGMMVLSRDILLVVRLWVGLFVYLFPVLTEYFLVETDRDRPFDWRSKEMYSCRRLL
jgi:hypothetical protein